MAKTATKKDSKKTAGSKTSAKKTAAPTIEAGIEPVDTAPETKAAKKEVKERTRDPRLPEPGTVLTKKDRHDATRCECVVEAGGVRYKDELFDSLSGAAAAAAKDLGLSSKANGFLFWGLTTSRRGTDPVDLLKKAWERYAARATALEGSDITADQRLHAVEAIEWHAEVIAELRGKLQTAKA